MRAFSTLLCVSLVACASPPELSRNAVVVPLAETSSAATVDAVPKGAAPDFNIPPRRPRDPCPEKEASRRGRWLPMSSTGAPVYDQTRRAHQTRWLAERMVLLIGVHALNGPPYAFTGLEGGIYDPCHDRWSRLESRVPLDAWGAAWVGSRLYSWAQRGSPAVAKLELPAGNWSPSSAPFPSQRVELLTFGDTLLAFPRGVNRTMQFQPAWAFDIARDRPTRFVAENAPSERRAPVALAVGSDYYFVWGGRAGRERDYAFLNDGAILLVKERRWLPMTTIGAPEARSHAQFGWTGSRLIVFGGSGDNHSRTTRRSGGIYDPKMDSWLRMADVVADEHQPGGFVAHHDGRMIFLGAADQQRQDPHVRVYDIAARRWSKFPLPRSVFGARTYQLDDGRLLLLDADMLRWAGVLDPKAQAWQEIDMSPVKGRRFAHIGWTGSRLIVWGGVIDHLLNAPCGTHHKRCRARREYPGDGAVYSP